MCFLHCTHMSISSEKMLHRLGVFLQRSVFSNMFICKCFLVTLFHSCFIALRLYVTWFPKNIEILEYQHSRYFRRCIKLQYSRIICSMHAWASTITLLCLDNYFNISLVCPSYYTVLPPKDAMLHLLFQCFKI